METIRLFLQIFFFSNLLFVSCSNDNELNNNELKSASTGELNSNTTTIFVDENSEIKNADKYLLGINHEWGYNQMNVTMEDGNVLDISQDCVNVMKTAGVHLPLNRMAGTSSQLMKWKEAIGPLAGRTSQGNPKVKQRMGIVEWINLVRSIDPVAEFVLVFLQFLWK